MIRFFSLKFRIRPVKIVLVSVIFSFFSHSSFAISKTKNVYSVSLKLSDKNKCRVYDYVLHLGDSDGHLSLSRCKIPQSSSSLVEHLYEENQEFFIDTGEKTYFISPPIEGDFPTPSDTVEMIYPNHNKDSKPIGFVMQYSFYTEGTFDKKTTHAVYALSEDDVCFKGLADTIEQARTLASEKKCLEYVKPKEKNVVETDQKDVWLNVVNETDNSLPLEFNEAEDWEYPTDPEITKISPKTNALIQLRAEDPYCCVYPMKIGTLNLKVEILKQKFLFHLLKLNVIVRDVIEYIKCRANQRTDGIGRLVTGKTTLQ